MNIRDDLKCVKFASLVLSVVTMLGSIGVIGFSIRALVEFGYISHLVGSNILTYGSVILLVAGITAFTLTPVGLYSTIIQNQSLMVIYMVAIFAVGGVSLSGSAMGYLMKQDIVSLEVKKWLTTSLQHEYGNPFDKDVTDAWDRLQQQLVCCGSDSATADADWLNSDWFASQDSFPRSRVPTSCCPTCATIHEKLCYTFLINPPKAGNLTTEEKICIHASQKCEDASDIFAPVDVCTGRRVVPVGFPKNAYLHTVGCYQPLEEELIFYSNRLMLFGVVFAAILFLSSVVTFMLSQLTFDEKYSPILQRRI